MSGGVGLDKIIIKGLKVFAFHGVNQEEKDKGQPFLLDVTLYMPLKKAGQTDDLEDTVSYARVSKAIVRMMNEKSYNLLEKAASEVAKGILMEFCEIESVDVLLKKPKAPVKAEFDYMSVEIFRTRSDFDGGSSD